MGINEGIILTDGLDMEDVKAILLHRKEVVRVEDYVQSLQNIDELLTLLALAVSGNKKAIQYLIDNAIDDFNNLVADRNKEDLSNHVEAVLNNKYPDEEEEDENITESN